MGAGAIWEAEWEAEERQGMAGKEDIRKTKILLNWYLAYLLLNK